MDKHLIFLHLPKNGGTTLNAILDRIYTNENSFSIKEKTPHKLNTEDFLKLSKDNKERMSLVKGHLKFGFHKNFSKPSEYFTFLRRPEERIISFYHYVLNDPNHRLNEKVKKMNLYEFVTRLKDADTNNAQVRWISGVDAEGGVMLQRALDNIDKHFSFVGLTEEFDESLILLQEKYKWQLPCYKVKNRTKNRPSLASLDERTRNAIAEHNIFDNKLYTTIKEKFEAQKSKTNLLRLKLMKLRLCNKIYSSLTS